MIKTGFDSNPSQNLNVGKVAKTSPSRATSTNKFGLPGSNSNNLLNDKHSVTPIAAQNGQTQNGGSNLSILLKKKADENLRANQVN
jgi:hypothetical protein